MKRKGSNTEPVEYQLNSAWSLPCFQFHSTGLITTRLQVSELRDDTAAIRAATSKNATLTAATRCVPPALTESVTNQIYFVEALYLALED